MDSISSRIIALRGEQARRPFAEKIGITESTLRNYEKGISSPDSQILQNICHNLRVSPEWLLLGTGPMTPKAPGCNVDLIMVPMVEARLSAGTGSLQVSGDSDRSHAFRSDFLNRKGSPKDMVLMRVEGDSMQPEIMDGDVVLLDKGKTDIRIGRIFAVGFEEAIYLKRIDLLPGKVVLKSVNPEYPPVELDVRGQVADLFRVIGQVLWVGREYR